MENFKEELRLMLDTKSIIQAESYDNLQITLKKSLNDEIFRLTLSRQTNNLTDNASLVLEKYTNIILNKLQ